jgi:hypothetical protein
MAKQRRRSASRSARARASDLLVLVHVRLTESFETQEPNAAAMLLDQPR